MATDVIVLGGGIIGCALAEELARHGQRVVIVERGAIGAEASAAAAGILAAQIDLIAPGPLFELCQTARRMYPGWIRHLERRSRIRLGYHRDGILYLAMTRAQQERMRRRARWQRRLGLGVEELSARSVRLREPSIDRPIQGGFFFPLESQVDNVALMRALAAACRRAGVRLQEQTTVRRVLVARGRVRGVKTNRGMLRAEVVVDCLGSWAGMNGRFPLPVPVEPVRGQMLAFNGPKRLFRHIVMSDRAYVVQRRDGSLLAGSTVERVGFDKSLTLEGMRGILANLQRFSLALARCRFREAWAGLRPYSQTGRPVMGKTRIPGLYLSTGHFRHGILLAPVTAALMSQLVLTGRASSDLSSFTPRS